MIDRRLLLKAGTLGLGALAFPGATQLLAARGFTHNVASGEPRQHSVMLWTRYLPGPGESGRLSWQVSADPDFGRILADGVAEASEAHDFCVKPVAGGLAPGRWYYFRFRDARGRLSPVGRTRTLPEGAVPSFRLGLFSCSNLGFGWFNAYGHAAARRDIDLMVHVGDYLYEYQRGRYPTAAQAAAGRVIEPAGEILRLADYRLRYAAYRSDPDLQRLHQYFPMIAMWDDHETANDSWQNGAQNHTPATEGDWAERKAAGVRAYREWLPVSDDPW
jgi:alkaline phosphatase D